MGTELERLLDGYESGHLTRRELLGALVALVHPVPRARQGEPVIGAAKTLNHATFLVPDVARSRAFYQELFGMPVLTRQDPGVNLAVGGGFLGLYPADPGARASIDHVCLGLERLDAEAIRRKLAARGLEAAIRMRGDTPELYFTDPDGIRVQLQDVRYRGGVGPLGDRDPA